MSWKKSTFSAVGNCVEVNRFDDQVLMRDSKGHGRVLVFTPGEWDAFLLGVKAGEFG